MGGGYGKQAVSCIVAKESIFVFLIHSLIRLCSSWQYLLNFSKKCRLCEFVLEGRTVGGKMGGGYRKQVVSCIAAQESILVFLIHSLIRLCYSWLILLIFRKNADSANSFSKVGLLGAKWVVAIKIRWCPALLQKSRFNCFSFICS